MKKPVVSPETLTTPSEVDLHAVIVGRLSEVPGLRDVTQQQIELDPSDLPKAFGADVLRVVLENVHVTVYEGNGVQKDFWPEGSEVLKRVVPPSGHSVHPSRGGLRTAREIFREQRDEGQPLGPKETKQLIGWIASAKTIEPIAEDS